MGMDKTSQFKALDERYFMPAFSRDMAIVKGEGSKVWDAEGREYTRLCCRDCRVQHRTLPPCRGKSDL